MMIIVWGVLVLLGVGIGVRAWLRERSLRRLRDGWKPEAK